MIGQLATLAALWRQRALPPERLAALQLEALRRTVHRARAEVPFYRDLYERAGVAPAVPETLDDLARLPLVTKADLRAVPTEDRLSRRLARAVSTTYHTSGTTGEPMEIRLSTAETRWQSLVQFRGLLELGFRPWETLVVVGPRVVPRPAPHQRLGLFRTMVVPGSLSTEAQAERLSRLRPDILWCYPAELRALLGHPGRPVHGLRPRLLMVSSAMLDEDLRRMAHEILGCDIVTAYGCMETGRIAIECRQHRGLHVNADHVLVEILAEGRPARPGEVGEVVVTTLRQRAMPFVRYRLGDLTSWEEGPCACGSTLPRLAPPQGRKSEVLRFRGGHAIPPYRIVFLLHDLPAMRQFQVVQESLDRLRVLVVPESGWLAEQAGAVADRLRALLPDGVEVTVERVDRIEARGPKRSAVVSLLPEEDP